MQLLDSSIRAIDALFTSCIEGRYVRDPSERVHARRCG